MRRTGKLLLNNPTKAEILKDIEKNTIFHIQSNFAIGGGNTDRQSGKWKTKRTGEKSYLQASGKLKSNIKSKILRTQIKITSNLKYSSIHNNGGYIVTTKKQRNYFLSQYYKTKQKFWKYLAFSKKIKMPQRHFLGNSTLINRTNLILIKHKIFKI